jgi:dTDP-4-amino-4,6-dideoxygalactose transaminase
MSFSNSNFIIFGSPLIKQDEIDEVVDSLKSGWIGTGQKVARFEEDFKSYKGVKHAADEKGVKKQRGL